MPEVFARKILCRKDRLMELTMWLVGLFLLGLAVMGLMFAFVLGCERV
jgi:hypothetical protein